MTGSLFFLLAAITSAIAAPQPPAAFRLDCPDPQGFALTADARDVCPGRQIVTVRLNRDSAALPPKFKLRFSSSAPGAQHVWTSEWEKDSFHLWPASWADGRRSTSELAKDTPIAVAFGPEGATRLAAATREAFEKVDFALTVCETNGCLEGFFEFFTRQSVPQKSYCTQILLDTRPRPWHEAVSEATEWIAAIRGFRPAEVPEAAYEPLYSTWYSFWQDVSAERLEREAELAAALGMKTMILDDGWQKVRSRTDYSACGDWLPVPSRFPDMKAHVSAVHRAGLKYMLWISVPYVGDESKAYGRFAGKFLKDAAEPGVKVLDPRFPEVRDYLIGTFERAVRDWGFDGLKLDFIDEFALAGEDPGIKESFVGRDIRGIPEAVDRLMKDALSRLKAIRPDVLVEFRQGYMGPAIRQYGNMIRALDCPVDPFSNRRRIANLRLTSGPIAVHSDMLAWNRDETPEGAALPILNALFSVIQYSMVLDTVSEEHRQVIRHWIDFTRQHREALLKGTFRPLHPEAGFPVIEAESAAERVIAVYNADSAVSLRGDKPTLVVNATAAETVVVDAKAAAGWTSFDVFGRQRASGRIDSGLTRLSVPRSGHVEFNVNGRATRRFGWTVPCSPISATSPSRGTRRSITRIRPRRHALRSRQGTDRPRTQTVTRIQEAAT